MELIAAILLAGPLGYFARRGLLLYLVVWAVIFPIQTVVVYSDSDPSGNDALYWVFNALILAFGVGLNRLGHRVRVRRGKVQGGLVMRPGAGAETIER
jgi:hypothetical protein